MELHLRSNNIRGLRNNHKRKSVFNDLKTAAGDIIFLQETHCTNDMEHTWKREWGNDMLLCNGTSQSAGVATLFRNNVQHKNYYSDNAGRLQIFDVNMHNKTACLVNIYAPNKDKDQVIFYGELFNLLLNRDYDELILGGDFNLVLSQKDKIGGTKLKKRNSLSKLNQIIDHLGLTDIWRLKHPSSSNYTWSQKNPTVLCRLDFFLITKGLESISIKSDIHYVPHTDHKMISLRIQGQAAERGPGFWKLNSSFMEDEDYCTHIRKLIDDKWLEYMPMKNKSLRYELVKFDIKQYSHRYGTNKAKLLREKERSIIQKINELDNKLVSNTINKTDQDAFYALKIELDEMKLHKAKGDYIRSRIEFVEKNERSTRFFFNQARESFSKKTLTSLKKENGDETTQPKEILYEIKQFYQRLYESKQIAPSEKLLPELNIPTLTEQDKSMCEGNITLEECYKSLCDMKSNKSPGSDGLTAEFYRKFWDQLGPKLVEVLNFSVKVGTLPDSLRRAVITILHKQGKPPNEIKNYRPISLLNIDYKILSKSLANRISPNLDQLISHDQTGFMKNRYIGENIRLISDIIEVTKRKNIPGLLLLLDFEKAYDTVEWEFMMKVLKAFNFGPSIIRWVKLCYTDISSTVLNNGFSCGWFQVKRGLRQGCGMSCVLFLLAAEILSILIKESKKVKGISVMGREYKLSQYADDTTCILSDKESAYAIIQLAKQFEQVSGLRLNIDKTQLIWLGPWKTKTEDIGHILRSQGNFTLLGTNLGYEHTDSIKANCENKISKLVKKQNLWTGRDLSIIGKILISKSLGLSNLVYSMSNVAFPDRLIQLTQKTVNNFIWNNKPAKVKHTTLRLEYEKGGLRSPDVAFMNKSLKLAWLSRMTQDVIWLQLANESFFQDFGGLQYLSRCNYHIKYLKEIPQFYYDLLSFLAELTNRSSNQIQIIWNNENVILNRKMIYKKAWKEAGIEYFKDLKSSSRRWLSLMELQTKYRVYPSHTEYNAVIQAIENSNYVQYDTKRLIAEHEIECKSGNIIDTTKARCRDYYREFIAMEKHEPTSLHFWDSLGFHATNIMQSLPIARSCTKDTKLIAFQYKIQNNIVACNSNLKKWGIIDNAACSTCQLLEDDIMHNLVECPRSRKIIADTYQSLNISCINFNPKGFLFGTGCKVLDLINIVIKWSIWKSRFHQTELVSTSIKQELTFRRKTDQFSLSKRKFDKKWNELPYLLF